MEDSHAWKNSVEQHIDKRAKVADTTSDAEGYSPNSESPSISNGLIKDILVKKFQAEREILLHTVGVEVLKWDVRRCSVKSCNVAAELEFAKSQIDENANNIHAWSHRKWVLHTFGGVYTEKIWDEELDYCTEMVDKDPFNSLVWDHRYFVVTRCLLDYYDDEHDQKKARKVDRLFWKRRDAEVDYAIKVIKGSGAGNQCPLSYFRSLFTVHYGSMALNRSVTSVVLWVLDKSKSTLKDLDGMEERSILNALNILLDLLSHGYEIEEDEVGKQILLALEALNPDCPAQFSRTYKVLVVLEKELTASGLVWRNAGSEFLNGTLKSFQRQFKFRLNKEWREKMVRESFCAPVPSLPAEKNEENDASANLPLPEEPEICKVGLCFPNRHKVRKNAGKVRRNALFCKVGLCFPKKRKVRRNALKVRRNALIG